MTPEDDGALAADEAIDTMTVALPSDLDERSARLLIEDTVLLAEGLWANVQRLYMGRAWIACGYDSWDSLCQHELRGRVALPREDRPTVVRSLRDAGLSTRAIAAAVGVSDGTVRNDLSGAQDYAPATDPGVKDLAPVLGRDGKSYRPREVPTSLPPEPRTSPGSDIPGMSPPVAEYLEREEPGLLEEIAWRKAFAAAMSRMGHVFAEWEPAVVAEKCHPDDLERYLSMERNMVRWFERVREARVTTPDLRVLRGGR